MPSSFNLFDCSRLIGVPYEYPDRLRAFASTGDHPDLYPWWFIDADSRAGRLAWAVRKHDGRNLIPFAKVDDGRGDVACFDADAGGDAVQMLVLDDSSRRYFFATFDEWLQAAMADAAKNEQR